MPNMHGKHEAICLCCEKLSITGYECGSEYTPESGVAIRCYANKFKPKDSWDGQSEIHEIMELAKDCDAFEGRK